MPDIRNQLGHLFAVVRLAQQESDGSASQSDVPDGASAWSQWQRLIQFNALVWLVLTGLVNILVLIWVYVLPRQVKPVNVNTATLDELESVLSNRDARAVLAYRQSDPARVITSLDEIAPLLKDTSLKRIQRRLVLAGEVGVSAADVQLLKQAAQTLDFEGTFLASLTRPGIPFTSLRERFFRQRSVSGMPPTGLT